MKRLFFFICICFACVLTAQAVDYSDKTKYLSKGDTVTIRQDGGMYLAVDDRGTTIIAHGEPNDNALWRIVWCLYKQESGWDQSQYQFQHVKTKKYLYVDAGTSGRNNYYANLTLIENNNPSLFIENNPTGTTDSYETASEIHYNHASANQSFHLTVDRNVWKLQQNKKTNIQIEKWSAKGNGGRVFKTYFSPETYDFKLVKSTDKDIEGNDITDESITQQKKVRFVLDLRDSTYTTCVRSNISDKKLLVSFKEERDLNKLKDDYGITPEFYWQSSIFTTASNGTTSTLTLLTGNVDQEDYKYFSEDYNNTNTFLENDNRKMLEIIGGEISTDNLAWEVTINAYGISPMSLVHKYVDDSENVTKRMVNYTDFLVVKWTYGNDTYTRTARIVRKSYHTHDLPQFDMSVSPSTYTFNNAGGRQNLNITGYHQHGVAYYDADERIVENVYTYGPKLIPLDNFDANGDGEDDLTVTFEFKDLNENPITWLTEEPNSRTDHSITIVAASNKEQGAQYRQAKVHGTFTLTKDKDGNEDLHTGTIAPIINQRANNEDIEFKHVDGINRNELTGTARQQVHTVERTIYYTSEQEGIQLQLAETNFFGYMRWYDYATDGDPLWNNDQAISTSWIDVPRGANGTNFKAINTSKGNSFGLYGTNREGQEGPLHRENANNPAPILKGWAYTYKENPSEQEAAAAGYHTIACDVSAYTDYNIKRSGNRVNEIVEPTLSYRQLFHLKPAEEMANKLKNVSEIAATDNTPATFLENYKYLAARGADVHLATNYRYAKATHQSEFCYFYKGNDGYFKRVGVDAHAEWWKVETKDGTTTRTKVGNPNYQVKDFLDIDSDFQGDVVYELIVPQSQTGLEYDLRIARFEITFVLKGACGPSQSTIMTTHEMEEHYQLLEHIDFCFKDKFPEQTSFVIPNTNNECKQLDYHLPWNQSTYGYYYPKADKYPNLGNTSSNRADQNIPYYGEYFLVNKMNKEWAQATAHGGVNDFALYVDGTTEPGRAFSITTGAKICAGQTLYCSAWLCNPCPTSHTWENPRSPIFRCNVEGREQDINGKWGEWEDVSVFFVGDLEKGSGWQQIVFPVLSDRSYDSTRISIYNFATGGNGNDFMVDDISLFVSRLPLASYQAQTNCASEANSASSTAVVLRIDYTEFQGERDEYMYYQIYKEKNSYEQNDTEHPVSLKETLTDNSAYLHDNNEVADLKTYGSVRIPEKDFDPEEYNKNAAENDKVLIFQTVQGFKDYLVDQVQNDPNGEKSTHAKAYIKTTDMSNKDKWLIYVMHIVPNAEPQFDDNGNEISSSVDTTRYLRECYDYTLRMANVPEELASPECNMQTPLHATQSTKFWLRNGDYALVNGDETDEQKLKDGFIPVSQNNCANDYYTLISFIENVMAIRTGGNIDRVSGEVLSDWLVGFEFDDVYANTKNHETTYQEAVRQADVAFKKQYKYTRGQVKTAIIYDLRRDDPLNTNLTIDKFEDLDPEAFLDPANYTIIKHLHDNGWLQLRRKSTSFYLASQDTARYWVYPIDGTASAEYGGQKVVLHDCIEPVWVSVLSAQSNHVLNIAPVSNTQKTDLQKRQIPTVRVLQSTLTNDDYITIPITDVEQAKTKIGYDDVNQLIKFELSNLDDNIHFVDSTTGQKIDAPTTFEIGKKYLMRMRFTDNGGNTHIGEGGNTGCRVGTVYFRLLVLPDRVIWAPSTGIYDGWGLDGNWRGWNDENNNGQIDNGELTAGYVPIKGSDVVIGNVPKADDVILPTLEISKHYPYVHDHNHYPMDVHAHASTCGRIYFAPGAHIHNQHLLNYEKAFVDMLLPAGKWNTVSVPLQNVYASGDFFIPHPNNSWWNKDYDNLESTNPFEVAEFSGRRHQNAAYAFWPAFYNQTTTKHYEGTKGIVEQAASADFVQSNTLSEEITLGSGFSIYGLGPGNNGNEGDLIVRLPKPDESYSYYTPSGEVSVNNTGTLDRTNSGKFAFTATKDAPKMEIILTNSVSGSDQSFLFGNPTMAYIDMYALLKDNDNEGKWSSFSYVTGSQWNATTTLLPSDRFLPPMTSVMLNTNSNAKELKVILKPEHLTLTNTEIPLLAPRPSASIRKNSAPEDERPVNDAALATEMMTIFASTSSASARTVLATNPAANDYYQIGEDALFISTGVENQSAVTTPLNMYTVAEQVPMMADVRQGISEIPMGMLVANGYRTSHMQVAFHLSANWTRSCYFCDSKTGQKIRIMDGMVISVEMPQNHEQRYFIEGPDEYIGSNGGGVTTSTTQPSGSGNAKVWAYSQESNSLTIGSSDIIQEVKVYDMAGRMIAHKLLDLFHSSVTLQAPAGVCLIEAVLRDGTILRTQTIVK